MDIAKNKIPRPSPQRPFPFPTTGKPEGSIKPGGPHWVDGPLQPGGPIKPGGPHWVDGPLQPGGPIKPGGPHWVDGPLQPGGPIKPGGPHWVDGPLHPGIRPTEDSVQLSPEALRLGGSGEF